MEPRPVTFVQAPCASGITTEFSVWRKPTHSPAASGLWAATAFRYVSRWRFRQSRLQFCALAAALNRRDATRQSNTQGFFIFSPRKLGAAYAFPLLLRA